MVSKIQYVDHSGYENLFRISPHQLRALFSNQGIELISRDPEYLYTRLPELKLEMLAEATQNAKKRAEQMTVATGNKIGFMRSAKMGVFQITPISSVDVSDWGENDTSSLEKKVMAVVKVDFSIVG